MNWDAIGAIAESLGAVGVIASLVYLAGQIRQSREQMRAATAQQLQAQVSSTAQEPVRNAELARLVRRGNENVDQLDEDERFRFTFYLWGILTDFDNAHYQYRVGLLDEARWRLSHSQLKGMLRLPGVASLWASEGTGGFLSPEFVALVEEMIAEEPDRGE
jgi:hypothetical protein